MIGKTIDRYKIIDKLGEGGMGSVWKAEDTKLNRLVALKTLSPHLVENEEACERFTREAQAASALNHSNITTVYDLLDTDDQHFICMEYVEGKTVRDILETGHVSVRKAVDIVLQAAAALEAAHRRGILHRDVKSANIMVSMEGNVKVMDFGLAHLEDKSQLTRTGTTMGTLAYSSPEQLTGRPYDERSEIWSLGVVFYELLTGQLPFRSSSEGELVFAIINNEQDRPSKLRDDIPPSVEAVATRMLDKDPTLRYASMGELISDLQSLRRELETSTVQPIPASGKRGFAGRPMAVKLVLILVPVLIVTAGIVSLLSRKPRLDPNYILVTILENRSRDQDLENIGQVAYLQLMEWINNKTGPARAVDIYGSLGFQNGQSANPEESFERYRAQALKLGAGTIVTGHYLAVGSDSLYFQLYLHDASKNRTIASLPLMRMEQGHESAMAESVVTQVMTALGREIDPRFAILEGETGPTRSYEAYRAFAAGLEMFFTTNDWEGAWNLFNRAIEHDPHYLSPRVWIARLLTRGTRLVTYHTIVDSLVEYLTPRRDALTQDEQYMLDISASSLTVDHDAWYRFTGEAAREIGGDYWYFEAGQAARWQNRPREALRFFNQIDPREALMVDWVGFINQKSSALHMLSRYRKELHLIRTWQNTIGSPTPISLIYQIRALAGLGQLDEIRELLQSNRDRMDLRNVYYWCVNVLPGQVEEDVYRAFVAEAIDYLQSLPQEEQGSTQVQYYLAHFYLLAGHLNRAKEIYEELFSRYNDAGRNPPSNCQADYGIILARQGDTEGAREIMEWLRQNEVRYAESHWILARAAIAVALGDTDGALDLLRQSRGDPLNISHWSKDWFSPLSSSSQRRRFQP